MGDGVPTIPIVKKQWLSNTVVKRHSRQHGRTARIWWHYGSREIIVKKHIRRHGKTRAKSEELITCRGRVNACNACNACNARNACNACNAHTHRLCKHLLPKHLLQVQGMSTPTMRSHAQCLFARVCVYACLCFFDCFVYSSSCDDTLGLIPKPTAELVDAEPVCSIFLLNFSYLQKIGGAAWCWTCVWHFPDTND